MKNAHFVLQGKGGVGKSTLAVFLAQYLKSVGTPFQGVDTDPVNQSFFAFKSLGAKHLEVLDQGTVNQRRFDSLIEEIISGDKDYLIDNGASSFIPLASYMAENNILDLLHSNNVRVFLHTPVVAGAAMRDSLAGMKAITDMTNQKNVVVWKNEHFGLVVHEGKPFEEMQFFKKAEKSVLGVITLRQRTASTFGDDLKKMLSMSKTFDECLDGNDFFITEKARIKIIRDDVFAEIDRVGGPLWTEEK